MSFKARVTHHIKQAEAWQARVEGYENAAARETEDAYEQAKILDRFDYRSAQKNRDGHQQRAIMYGIASILEEFDRQRAEQQMQNPRQVGGSWGPTPSPST